jgi:hypothetical protein
MRLVISAFALAALGVTTAAAQAAPMHKHHYWNTAGVSTGPGFQGGVLRGPLYNGQDYLGDDPDPNIRAYLLRDLGSRYGGGR